MEFIKRNKCIIITFIVLLIVAYLIISPTLTPVIGYREYLDPETTIETVKVEDIVGKNINLSCEVEVKDFKKDKIETSKEKFYLGIAPKSQCINIDENTTSCALNIPILQKGKNRFTVFTMKNILAQTLQDIC